LKLIHRYPVLKALMGIAVAFFLLSCSTVDRMIHPTPSSPSSAAQTAGETQKQKNVEPQPKATVVPSKSPEPIKPPPSPAPPRAASLPPQPPAAAPKPIYRVTQVVWDSVNLREGPGTNFKVVGNIKKGTTLAILEEKGDWLRVRLENGKEIWMTKAATIEAPKPTLPASPSPPKPKPM